MQPKIINEKRQSNFELLRIISMLFIILHHFSNYGKLLEISNPISNKIFGEFINIGGKLGVNLFILISGYFLIKSRFKLKKILKIIFEVWIYSVGIALIMHILKIGDLDKKLLLKSFLPISYKIYWFVTPYIGMYLLFPIINKLINNLDKKQLKTIVIILGLMLSVIPTLVPKSTPFNSNLFWFIYLYIIASYIRLYGIKYMENNKRNLKVIIFIVLFMFLSSIVFTFLGIKISIFNKVIIYFNTMYSLPMLVLSVFVFNFFKNITLQYNKMINKFAGSSLAVYLIHLNPIFVNYLFFNIIRIQNFYEKNTIILIGYVFITTIIIYLICSLVDFARIKFIEEPLFKFNKFDKYIEKIDSIMNV